MKALILALSLSVAAIVQAKATISVGDLLMSNFFNPRNGDWRKNLQMYDCTSHMWVLMYGPLPPAIVAPPIEVDYVAPPLTVVDYEPPVITPPIEPPVIPPPSVNTPETSTWVMMLIGFAALAGASLRKRTCA